MRVSDFPELPTFTFTDQPWSDQALCREVGGDVFFPDRGGANVAAKRVCAACPVTTQCDTWAVVTEQAHGVWGGRTGEERRAAKYLADSGVSVLDPCQQMNYVGENRRSETVPDLTPRPPLDSLPIVNTRREAVDSC